MHSKEIQVRVFRSLVAFLLSPLLTVGSGLTSQAWAQEPPEAGKESSGAASGTTVRSGKIQLDAETSGLDKPKSSSAMGKVVFREGTVKINKDNASAGADVKQGAVIEAGSDGRALIVLKKKAQQSDSFNPEEFLGTGKTVKKKTSQTQKKLTTISNNSSGSAQQPRKKQMGLSKGIDVRRVQYIALVGDAQARLDNNEIAIETKDGEAILNQGTSRIFNLGPNSKMRVPAQPQVGITGTLCHGTLSGIARPATASSGPNIETSSGIVNFPSGGRFVVEAAGSGLLAQCDDGKKSKTGDQPAGGIRVVSLDAPGRLILAQRPQTKIPPAVKRNTQPDRKEEKEKRDDLPASLSLTGGGGPDSSLAIDSKKSNDGGGEKKTADNEKKSNDVGGEKKTSDNEKKSNDGGGEKKAADNEKKSNDGGGEKKTSDNEKKSDDGQKSKGGKPVKTEDSPLDIDQGKGNDKFIGSDSPAAKGAEKRIALNDEKQHDGDGTRQPGQPAKDEKPPQSGKTEDSNKKSNDGGGEKKAADNEKKSDDGEKSKGGKPVKTEDSPLDIDQGKGNDKFIGTDSPAAKGAEKRIALNDEKQHDGDGTRQPGQPAKNEKPPQSGKTEDSNKKSNDGGGGKNQLSQKSEGVLEFGAMQDVKAPVLPDMKNMTEQQKKDVYKNIAEKTESAPVPKSLASNLVGQMPSDLKLVASNDNFSNPSPLKKDTPANQSGERKDNTAQRGDANDGKSRSNQSSNESKPNESNEEKLKDNGNTNEKKGAKDKDSNDTSADKNKEKGNGISGDEQKKSKSPLISPPKLTPPPPPKIDATQMPLSSDVLIKLRKKVK